MIALATSLNVPKYFENLLVGASAHVPGSYGHSAAETKLMLSKFCDGVFLNQPVTLASSIPLFQRHREYLVRRAAELMRHSGGQMEFQPGTSSGGFRTTLRFIPSAQAVRVT